MEINEADGAYEIAPGSSTVGFVISRRAPSRFVVTPCPKCDEAPALIVPGPIVAGVILAAMLRCTCGTSWQALNCEAFADG